MSENEKKLKSLGIDIEDWAAMPTSMTAVLCEIDGSNVLLLSSNMLKEIRDYLVNQAILLCESDVFQGEFFQFGDYKLWQVWNLEAKGAN